MKLYLPLGRSICSYSVSTTKCVAQMMNMINMVVSKKDVSIGIYRNRYIGLWFIGVYCEALHLWDEHAIFLPLGKICLNFL